MKSNDLIIYQGIAPESKNILPSNECAFNYYLEVALNEFNEDGIFYPTIKEVIDIITDILIYEDYAGILSEWEDPDLYIPEEACEVCTAFETTEALLKEVEQVKAEYPKGYLEFFFNEKSETCLNKYDLDCPYRRGIYEDFAKFLNSELLNVNFMTEYFRLNKMPFSDPERKTIVNNPQLSAWE
jgi:hypothetical protein